MSEEENNVGTLVTLVTAGGEMVGRYLGEDDDSIKVENPRAFVQTEKGVGFAPSVCLTGKREPEMVSFGKYQVILIVETNPEIEKLWLQATTGLVV